MTISKSLDDLAKMGRSIIYYDQLGCGKSPVPSNPDLWSTGLWEEEIDVVREALNLTEVHILGQSWGGMLAMQYAISKPKGIKSMVVASSPASIALWVEEANRLISYLPKQMQEAIYEGENNKNYTSPAYKEAYDEYYKRHVCNMDSYPDYVDRSFSQAGEVYMVMQGASEFVVQGKLRGWDVTDQLATITIPTLLTSGDMDEATPLIVKNIYDRIPNCEWELLHGTHLVHVEKRDEYNNVINNYLNKMEANEIKE